MSPFLELNKDRQQKLSTASSLKTSTVKDKCTVCVKRSDEIVGNLVLRADGRYAKYFFYFLRADSHANYITVINGKDVDVGYGE